MKASQVMTRDVATITPDAPVLDALRLMLERRISGLPVIGEDGRLVGIVTEGDFVRRAELDTERRRPRWLNFLLGPGRLASEYVGTHGRRTEEVMTRDVVAVDGDAPLAEVVDLMEKHGIKRVPVVHDGRLVGIVSRADLLRAFAACLMQSPDVDTSDAAIVQRIEREIEKQPWGPASMMQVSVDHGTAHLRVVLIDDREREALRVLVENDPGVTRVLDHLTTVEAMTGSVVQSAPDPG